MRLNDARQHVEYPDSSSAGASRLPPTSPDETWQNRQLDLIDLIHLLAPPLPPRRPQLAMDAPHQQQQQQPQAQQQQPPSPPTTAQLPPAATAEMAVDAPAPLPQGQASAPTAGQAPIPYYVQASPPVPIHPYGGAAPYMAQPSYGYPPSSTSLFTLYASSFGHNSQYSPVVPNTALVGAVPQSLSHTAPSRWRSVCPRSCPWAGL